MDAKKQREIVSLKNLSNQPDWRHYYLTSDGSLRKRKKSNIPRYLRKIRSTPVSARNSVDYGLPSGVFRGWNRSAYMRFRHSF